MLLSIPHKGKKYVVQSFYKFYKFLQVLQVLQVSADLPARSRLANMKQFNGRYGCLVCENPGSTLPTGHLHRFWPDIPGSRLRSHESVIKNASDATSNQKPVCIIITILYNLYILYHTTLPNELP